MAVIPLCTNKKYTFLGWQVPKYRTVPLNPQVGPPTPPSSQDATPFGMYTCTPGPSRAAFLTGAAQVVSATTPWPSGLHPFSGLS